MNRAEFDIEALAENFKAHCLQYEPDHYFAVLALSAYEGMSEKTRNALELQAESLTHESKKAKSLLLITLACAKAFIFKHGKTSDFELASILPQSQEALLSECMRHVYSLQSAKFSLAMPGFDRVLELRGDEHTPSISL